MKIFSCVNTFGLKSGLLRCVLRKMFFYKNNEPLDKIVWAINEHQPKIIALPKCFNFAYGTKSVRIVETYVAHSIQAVRKFWRIHCVVWIDYWTRLWPTWIINRQNWLADIESQVDRMSVETLNQNRTVIQYNKCKCWIVDSFVWFSFWEGDWQCWSGYIDRWLYIP